MRLPIVAVAAAAFLAGCGGEPPPASAPTSAPVGATAGKPAAPASGDYPLTTCVVSDEALGSMGDPVVFTHEGVEVRLCCPACRKEFDKDPAKFLAKIAAAKR